MLYSVSKQIAYCYCRAAECKELAALSVRPSDRQFHVEREEAWLNLARSCELQERVNEMVKELQRSNRRRYFSTARNILSTIKAPPCPTCDVEMQFAANLPATRTLIASLERVFLSARIAGA